MRGTMGGDRAQVDMRENGNNEERCIGGVDGCKESKCMGGEEEGGGEEEEVGEDC